MLDERSPYGNATQDCLLRIYTPHLIRVTIPCIFILATIAFRSIVWSIRQLNGRFPDMANTTMCRKEYINTPCYYAI